MKPGRDVAVRTDEAAIFFGPATRGSGALCRSTLQRHKDGEPETVLVLCAMARKAREKKTRSFQFTVAIATLR